MANPPEKTFTATLPDGRPVSYTCSFDVTHVSFHVWLEGGNRVFRHVDWHPTEERAIKHVNYFGTSPDKPVSFDGIERQFMGAQYLPVSSK